MEEKDKLIQEMTKEFTYLRAQLNEIIGLDAGQEEGEISEPEDGEASLADEELEFTDPESGAKNQENQNPTDQNNEVNRETNDNNNKSE